LITTPGEDIFTMTGIAGVSQPGCQDQVNLMLDMMCHRGTAGRKIINTNVATFGVVWNQFEADQIQNMMDQKAVWDYAGPHHFARADVAKGKLSITRDLLGVVPLYYGNSDFNQFCFASEVKGLLPVTSRIKVLSPGSHYNGRVLRCHFPVFNTISTTKPMECIAEHLKELINESVKKRICRQNDIGVWLSGGLDSSIMAAFAKHYVKEIHTFVAGVVDSEDLRASRVVADHIDSIHHEVIVDSDQLLRKLPEVIYHLESFDALLVRSSVMNYIVSEVASKYVNCVFSGEGADELFAGYRYIKNMDSESVASELIDITSRLHNTALQRVDRCASAHSMKAYVGFLDPNIVKYAFKIPPRLKLNMGVEKWILRKTARNMLPRSIVERTKSKFWQGAGVENYFAQIAEQEISDTEFKAGRYLQNGLRLNTKEELMYYRIFHERFGEIPDFTWMGRTKNVRSTNNFNS
jgi:asparagine synthase (glutamine-hydrolysing)